MLQVTYPITKVETYETSLDGFRATLSPEVRDYFDLLDLESATVNESTSAIETVFSIKGKNGEKTFKTEYEPFMDGSWSLAWYHYAPDGTEERIDSEPFLLLEEMGFNEYQTEVFYELLTLLSDQVKKSISKGIRLDTLFSEQLKAKES
jgi:hypothetical protein